MTLAARAQDSAALLRVLVLSLVLSLVLVFSGCASHSVYNPVTGKNERGATSPQQLQQQADEARETLIDEHGLYSHPEVEAYVSEIGLKLASVSHLPQLRWRFTLLDTEISNAFSLPGGQVFLTRGLLAHQQNEAELAAVLGHEIAHVTALHGLQRANEAAFAATGLGAALRVGEFLERQGLRGATQRLKRVGLSVAHGMLAHNSREQEFEADRLAADYLARAGYDAREMAGVLQTLRMIERFEAERARQPSREAPKPDWLASHPATEQRQREVERLTATARKAATSDGRQRFLERIDGLVFGDSPDRGLVRDRLFVHPRAGYAITAPVGWELDVEGSAAILHAPEGDTSLTVRLLPRIAGRSPQEAIRNVLTPTQGRGSARQVGGFPGMHFVGSRLQGDVRQPLRSTIVSGPGERLFLIDYTSRSGEFPKPLLDAMQQAEQSFRAITPADRRAARVWRINRVPMPAGGFAALARVSALSDDAETTLRLLNGLYGVNGAEAEPAVGAIVKTVR